MTPQERANKAQAAAADPGASVFVTANAGSGKTKVLVDRIARLLLAGAAPSAFLCITYTKAAAAEMQRRLFERLGGWCVTGDEALAAELTALGAPPASKADLGVARGLFARALETPGGLRIQTIHAFCERLLARFPLEAGVAPGFDIADEARANALLAMARAATVLGTDGDESAAFARFATRLHNDALDGLLDRLALRRAEFARFVHLSQGVENATRIIRERHRVSMSEERFVAERLSCAPWRLMREALPVLAGGGARDKDFGARIASALSAYERSADRDALLSLIGIAMNKEGNAYKSLTTKECADKHPWLRRLCEEIIEWAREAKEGLNAIDRAEDAQAVLTLALRLDDAYTRTKARFGALDFEDLIVHAQALLSRSEAAAWVLYKLDGGIEHILIDEGQDTSAAQWELIAPLQEEFFAGVGARKRLRTVFAVGDPKQSIYGFQGADPRRFLDEAQTLESRARKADRDFTAPTLETSFRSSPEILRVVDETFRGSDLALGEPEKFNEIRHFSVREQEVGLVEVWPIAPRPKVKESKPWDAPLDVETGVTAQARLAKEIARKVKTWIETHEGVWEKGALRPMRAGDVLALVRTRGALFYELIKAFKREKLPVAGADRMVLRDELAVEDCLALVRVALDPADDLSLACVLKGPWCDLDDDDADIFPLAHGRGEGETLFARLMANDAPKYAAPRAFVSEIVSRAGADAFAFLSWALESPTSDGRTGWTRVLARLGAEMRDPLEELLSRALRSTPYAAPSLQRFLHEIESDAGQVKRELEIAGGAIRVMTVHGAKGLEAPVVILPDSTSALNEKPDDGLIFTEQGPFLCPNEKCDDAASEAARAAHKRRAMGEHLRLLYVAMTRARDRLVVCGAQYANSRTGEAQTAWRPMVERAMRALGAEACETPFGEGLRLGTPHIVPFAGTVQPVEICLPTWARSPVASAKKPQRAAPSRMKAVDPAVFSPRGEGQKRFRRGRMIHGLLERLPDLAPSRRQEAARAWLQRQGASDDEIVEFTREALAVIEKSAFAAIFSSKSRAEIPVVGKAHGRDVSGVVDRLVLTDDAVLVLDYKTDRPAPRRSEDTPDAYLLQMALYREVLSNIFPQKAVRCALLWTEAPRLIELSEAQLQAALEALPAS